MHLMSRWFEIDNDPSRYAGARLSMAKSKESRHIISRRAGSSKKTCSCGKKRRKRTTRRRGVNIRRLATLAYAILAALFLPVIKDLYRRSAHAEMFAGRIRSTIGKSMRHCVPSEWRFPIVDTGQGSARRVRAKANSGMNECRVVPIARYAAFMLMGMYPRVRICRLRWRTHADARMR